MDTWEKEDKRWRVNKPRQRLRRRRALSQPATRRSALPLAFLKHPFQRFHAERLEAGVLVEGELSQLAV